MQVTVFATKEPRSWLPLWHPCKLPEKVLTKDFVKLIEELGHDPTMFPSDYYCFVMRVCNVYHASNKDNHLDLNRFSQCQNAVTEVFNTIPARHRPHGGDEQIASTFLLPILESMFDMQPRGPLPGTPASV